MQNYPVAKWLRKTMSIFTVQVSLILITFGVAVAHDNVAQVLEREVTVSLREAKFKFALSEIEKAAHVKFVYSDEQMPLQNTVTLNADKRKLSELLTELLHPFGIEFEADDNTEFVALKRIKKKNDTKQSMQDQGGTTVPDEIKLASVNGIVTDETTNQPLAGVNVIIKGTTNGTSTDAEGKYVINAEANDILVFSFIGYVSQEIFVNNRTVIDLALREDVQRLNEVTVNAGYWNVSERENTGNISKVDSEVITRQPVSNPLQALQGRMTGVVITQQSGVPGSAFTVRVRGQNSLRNTPGANEPLYIIDGVPFTSTPLSVDGQGISAILPNSVSPLNSINPSEIESIEVLKDADATAIYGSRGANGVVLITTRKGKSEKPKVEFNLSTGMSIAPQRLKLLNSQQWMEMRHEAFKNDQAEPQPWDYDMNGIWDSTRYTDWQKKLIGNTARTTNLQGVYSGGNQYTQFLISGGYYQEGTVFPGDFAYKKGSGHFSLSHTTANKKFNTVITTSYVADNNSLSEGDFTGKTLELSPVAPNPYNEDGSLNWQSNTWVNPYADLLNRYKAKSNNLVSNLILNYEILPGLNVKSSVGYTSMSFDEISKRPKAATPPAWGVQSGSSTLADNRITTWIIEPQLSYNKKISKGVLNVLAGSTIQENIRQGKVIGARGFTSDVLLENLAAASSVTLNQAYVQYKYAAIFSRINYTWDGKYVLNLTGRRDGSSRFGPDKQFANFGAVGAAWIFSQESFIKKNLPFISFGKIRSSYGITGSDNISDYGFFDTYSTTPYSYQGNRGIKPTRLVNPDYSWESNRKGEVGMELSALDNRVSFSSSWYLNRSSNQLVGYALPLITGFSSVQYNLPATVENRGTELTIGSTIIRKPYMNWTTSFNFTFPQTKLIEYPNLETSSYKYQYVVGKPLTLQNKYHFTGIDKQTGIYTFEDFNNDGSLSLDEDSQLQKSVSQDFYGGFMNSFSYKGFQIDFLFQFVKQTGWTYLKDFPDPPGSNIYSNQPTVVMNRWRQSGDVTSIGKFTQQYGSGAYASYQDGYFYGDNTIGDASFIRLKNVEVSYRFPEKWLSLVKLNDLKLFCQGQNLATITNYVGRDPESQNSRMLPPLRTVRFGLQISL